MPPPPSTLNPFLVRLMTATGVGGFSPNHNQGLMRAQDFNGACLHKQRKIRPKSAAASVSSARYTKYNICQRYYHAQIKKRGKLMRSSRDRIPV